VVLLISNAQITRKISSNKNPFSKFPLGAMSQTDTSYWEMVNALFVPMAVVLDLDGSNRMFFLIVSECLNFIILWNLMTGIPRFSKSYHRLEVLCIVFRIFANF
jgi:hypothetical protein